MALASSLFLGTGNRLCAFAITGSIISLGFINLAEPKVEEYFFNLCN